MVATGSSQRLNILADGPTGAGGVTLSVPDGAYPAGTKVTLRWMNELGLTGEDVDQLNQFQFRHAPYGDVAVQVLPAAPLPASPLALELPAIAPTTYDILHANECDAAWQIAGTAQGVALGPYSASVSFEIASPGLWALGLQPDGGQSMPAERPEAGCRTSSDGGGQ